ncbi:MAG: UDP-2,4-diacetamido-2,4,6-trideoxy-beta-L-altropyranose hydrolase [Pseudomonadota bacterium]|nr:UDP-2,4-diacetamido-2,4,6-trideoxy-beta-L-altropyranose hydrolase [Pseudomonadota bacterium]
MRVVIRADASYKIGSGHIYRCLSLATELNKRGAEVFFICRQLSGNLCDLLSDRNFRVFRLPAPEEGAVECLPVEDARETMDVLASLAGVIDWLVVDHYNLGRAWESEFRGRVENILVLDDLADREHDCDVLLDQGFYPGMKHRYHGLVPADCRLLLGPHYALLDFSFARQSGEKKEKLGKRLFVFFGGSDATNETGKTLAALPLLANRQLQLDVVVGGGNPYREKIEKQAASCKQVKFHYQVDTMASLMAKADIALGAGGTTTWERCCLGLPSIVISVADNQTALSATLGLDGRILYLGESSQVGVETIAQAIQTLLDFPWWRRSLSRRSRELVDGYGCRRLSRILLPEKIDLRRAEESDCEKIHAWRNAEITRLFSFSGAEISLDAHQQWFHKSLADERRVLLIGEQNDQPVGVLRYDFISELKALVSVYLVPGYHGHGLGSSLIREGSSWIQSHYPACQTIQAEVLKENVAGRKVFLAAGFGEYYGVFQEELAHE